MNTADDYLALIKSYRLALERQEQTIAALLTVCKEALDRMEKLRDSDIDDPLYLGPDIERLQVAIAMAEEGQ